MSSISRESSPATDTDASEDSSTISFADPDSPVRSERMSLGYMNLPPRKQCVHPTNVWFRDPRHPPRPLRSHTSILRDAFQTHTSMNAYYHATLESYGARDECFIVTENAQDKSSETQLFPQFMLLPPEIRWQIWQLAVPARVLNIGQLQLPDPIDIRNLVLPVPHIARVCREALDAVLRMGTKLALGRNIGGFFDISPAGYVLPSDIPFYTYGSIDSEELKVNEADPDGVTATTAGLVAPAVGCKTVAVHWPSPMEAFTEKPFFSARFFDSKVREWEFLRDCPKLETLLVLFRAPISLHLGLDWGHYNELLKKHGAKDTADDVEQAVTQLIVDLYDDQLLAELTSLETLRSSITRPRYIADYIPQKLGPCLNCERVQWERHHKIWVKYFWLQFYARDLNDRDREAIFPKDGVYKHDHPWVQEKLRAAPEFRPAVFIYLHFGAMVPDGDWGDEPADNIEEI